MPLDTSWMDNLPEVAASAPPGAQPPPQGSDWSAVTLPEVTDHPSIEAKAPPVETPGHAVSGPTGNLWTDIPRQVGSALLNAGVTAISPLTGLKSAYGGGPGGVSRGPTPSLPEAQNNAYNALGATEYQPATMGGRMAQAALTGAALGVTDPASIPAMAAGGATGELAASLAPNHPDLARILGFVPGAVAARGLSNLPLPPRGGSMDPETAALAQTATKTYGIPLAPGQISGNPFVRYFYSETGKLPFSGAEKFSGMQRGAFMRGLANTMGEDAEKITPEVMQAAKDRIGGVFNGVAARTSIPASGNFLSDLQNIVSNAKLSMSADNAAVVDRQAMNILDTAANNAGNIGGKAYIDLTAKNGPLDSMQNSPAKSQLRDLLDTHLQQNASPEDIGALTQARAQWKAMRTIEPLTLRADAIQGATPSTGEISPAALRAAVNRSYSNAAFAPPGAIPLNDLAKIGQRFLKEPPDSGTATRSLASHAMAGVGGLGALMTGHELGYDPLTTAAVTAGTLGANRMAQSVLRSRMLANRMIGAGMNPNGFAFTYPWMLQGPAASMPAIPFAGVPGQASPSNSFQR